MAGMVSNRRKKPTLVTVANPDAGLSMVQAAQVAGVSQGTMHNRRAELQAAGAAQSASGRWEITPRQMETAGIIKIRTPKPKPEADPLEAAQAAREAARREQAAEVRRNSPTREESAGTPPPDRTERESQADDWQAAWDREKARREAAADPYGARVRQTVEHAQVAAEGLGNYRVTTAEGAELAELRHAAEIAELRHAAELAEARREVAEAKALARAHADRAATMELLAKERGNTIAMLQAMLGGTAPVTRALDA